MTPLSDDEELTTSLNLAQQESTSRRLEAIRETIRTWDRHSVSVPVMGAVDPPTETLELDPRTEQMRAVPAPVTPSIRPAAGAAGWWQGGWWQGGRWRWFVAAAVVLLAVAGIVWGTVGSSPKPPVVVPPTPLIHSEAAVQFIGAEKASGLADSAVTDGLANLHGLPTVPEVSEVVTPYVAALQRFQIELAIIKWPTPIAGAAASLLLQVASFATFVQTISSTQPIGLGSWMASFQAHRVAVNTAENHVRHDLGLPTEASPAGVAGTG